MNLKSRKILCVVLATIGMSLMGVALLLMINRDALTAFPTPRIGNMPEIIDSTLADTLSQSEPLAVKAEPKPEPNPEIQSKPAPKVEISSSAYSADDSVWISYTLPDGNVVESPGEGYHIRISKSKHQLTLFKDGEPQKVYPVGVGKKKGDKTKVDDASTPEGSYYIEGIYNSKDWKYKGVKAYGPWFLRLDTKEGSFSGDSWTGFGIHGTNNEKSIGNYVSLGCIRMYNKDITELKDEIKEAVDSSKVKVTILP